MMTKKLIAACVISLIFIFSQNVFAVKSNGENELSQLTKKITKACHSKVLLDVKKCDKPYSTHVLLELSKPDLKLSADLQKKFDKIVADQVKEWALLSKEGYELAGRGPVLSFVQSLEKDKKVVAYLIAYQQDAVNKSDDTGDEKEDAKGMIYERSFVSADFKAAIIDPEAEAEFESSED